MASDEPSFMRWLGRQVGHVTRAVAPPASQKRIIYRREHVEEHESPQDPSVKLRRTVVDEVVVERSIDTDP